MNVQPDTSSSLANHRTVLESIVDSFYRIILHAYQEARAHLGIRGASIEKCRRGVSKVAFGHKVICLEDTVNVRSMYTNRNTHDHMLRTFGDTPIDTEEVRSLKCLESKTTAMLILINE